MTNTINKKGINKMTIRPGQFTPVATSNACYKRTYCLCWWELLQKKSAQHKYRCDRSNWSWLFSLFLGSWISRFTASSFGRPVNRWWYRIHSVAYSSITAYIIITHWQTRIADIPVTGSYLSCIPYVYIGLIAAVSLRTSMFKEVSDSWGSIF